MKTEPPIRPSTATSPCIPRISQISAHPAPIPSHKPPLAPPLRIHPVPLPCCFPHRGYPHFLSLYLCFILGSGSGGVPNPSQSSQLPGSVLQPLSQEAPLTVGEMAQGVCQEEQGQLRQQPRQPYFRGTLSLCSPCRFGGAFESSPISLRQQKH